MHVSITIIIWLFYLSIFGILLANVVNPRFFWEKFESWKATSEPSKTYFVTRRITSTIGLIIITLIMVGPTIMYLLDK